MKKTLIFAMLLVGYTNYAQTDAEYEVKYVIDYFFEGFHQSDSLKMKSVIHKDMVMQSIQKNKEGLEVLVKTNTDQFISLVTQYAKTQGWEEQVGVYSYQIDGNMAHVWVPYHFYLNGMLSHCGANSIQLLKEEEGWKIISMLDTRRKNNCN